MANARDVNIYLSNCSEADDSPGAVLPPEEVTACAAAGINVYICARSMLLPPSPHLRLIRTAQSLLTSLPGPCRNGVRAPCLPAPPLAWLLG